MSTKFESMLNPVKKIELIQVTSKRTLWRHNTTQDLRNQITKWASTKWTCFVAASRDRLSASCVSEIRTELTLWAIQLENVPRLRHKQEWMRAVFNFMSLSPTAQAGST